MTEVFAIIAGTAFAVVLFVCIGVMGSFRFLLWAYREKGPWVVARKEGGIEVYFALFLPSTPKSVTMLQMADWTTVINSAWTFDTELEARSLVEHFPGSHLRPLSEVKREQMEFFERMAEEKVTK